MPNVNRGELQFVGDNSCRPEDAMALTRLRAKRHSCRGHKPDQVRGP